MPPDTMTIAISIVALIVSVFALGWNFYRDGVTNLGPGSVIIESIYMAKMSSLRFLGRPLLKLLRKKSQYAHIMYDYTNPYSSKLPSKLNVGERLTLLLPEDEDSSIAFDQSHFGVVDSFGRYHWATRRSLHRTKEEYFEKYGKKAWGA